MFIAGDDNTVSAYTIDDGEPDGLVTRFTSFATALHLNGDGSKMVAGARFPFFCLQSALALSQLDLFFLCSDFAVKLIDVESKDQKVICEHEAPVLHVTFDPESRLAVRISCSTFIYSFIKYTTYFQVSTSCDGSINVYDVNSEKIVKTLKNFPKSKAKRSFHDNVHLIFLS